MQHHTRSWKIDKKGTKHRLCLHRVYNNVSYLFDIFFEPHNNPLRFFHLLVKKLEHRKDVNLLNDSEGQTGWALKALSSSQCHFQYTPLSPCR